MPYESRQEVIDYFNTCPGGNNKWSGQIEGACVVGRKQNNPYLRWPVILDEYTKNRDVWRCPSAKVEGGAGAIVPYNDYLAYWQNTEGQWGETGSGSVHPCSYAYPRGWGGDITDGVAQQVIAAPAAWGEHAVHKAFIQSIACNVTDLMSKKMVEVEDPVNYVCLGDGGVKLGGMSIELAAYPDICCLGCSGVCSWVDWVLCTWAQDCGLYQQAPNDGSFIANPELRKPYARHLGGCNLGFLDGHAAWWASERIITAGAEGDLGGLWFWAPTSADDSWVSSCYPDAIYIY
jgi:prepilin-type processing-associated H-X9-DG protein